VPVRSSGQADPRARGARRARPSYTDGGTRLHSLDAIFIIHSEVQPHVRLTPVFVSRIVEYVWRSLEVFVRLAQPINASALDRCNRADPYQLELSISWEFVWIRSIVNRREGPP
jgi:hypothetical protein